MASQDKIQQAIDSFTETITNLVRESALEHVQEALSRSGLSALPQAAAPKPAKRGARRGTSARKASGKRVRRTAADLEATAGQIHTFVKANPGCAMSDLVAALGETAIKLRPALQLLLGAKKLRTTGQKRGTKYFDGGAVPSAARSTGGASKKKTPSRKKKASKRKAVARKSSSKKRSKTASKKKAGK